jgi:hypothetical protein
MKKGIISLPIILSIVLLGCGNNNSVSLEEYTKLVEEKESLKAELSNSVPKAEFESLNYEKESLQDELNNIIKDEYDDNSSNLLDDKANSQYDFELADYWTYEYDIMLINNDKSFSWYKFATIGEDYQKYGKFIKEVQTGIIDDYTLYIKKQYSYHRGTTPYYSPDDILDSEFKDSNRSYVINMITNNVFTLYDGNHMTNMSFTRQNDFDLVWEEPIPQNESPNNMETPEESIETTSISDNESTSAEAPANNEYETSESSQNAFTESEWSTEEYVVSQNGANVRYVDNPDRVYTQLPEGTIIGRVKDNGEDWVEFTLDGIEVLIHKDYIQPNN